MKTVQIPDSVYDQAAQLAQVDNVSVDRFVSAIVIERVSEWSRIQARAARGSLEKFHQVMSKVSDAPPDPIDSL